MANIVSYTKAKLDQLLIGKVDVSAVGALSAASSEVKSGYAARWQPNTSYLGGFPVLNPAGQIVTALVDHNSGATYDASKWSAIGFATLDNQGKIPVSQLPQIAINDTFVVASQAAMLALTAQRGDMARRTDMTPAKLFVLASDDATNATNWIEITASGAVTSVDGQTGSVSLGAVAATNDSLARRSSTGTLTAGTATVSTELTTKGQMDAADTAAITLGRTEVVSRTLTSALTLATNDISDVVFVNNTVLTSVVVVTIPTNASDAIPIGSWIDVCAIGVGAARITPAGGVTLRGDGRVYGGYGTSRLLKIGTNEWAVVNRSIPPGSFARCFAYADTNVNGWAAGWQPMPLNQESIDSHNGHNTGATISGSDVDTTTQQNRYTVQPGQAGDYKVSGMITANGAAGSNFHVRIVKNNLVFPGSHGIIWNSVASATVLTGEKLITLAEGDFLGMQGYCSNGSWNTTAGEAAGGGATSWMSVERVS